MKPYKPPLLVLFLRILAVLVVIAWIIIISVELEALKPKIDGNALGKSQVIGSLVVEFMAPIISSVIVLFGLASIINAICRTAHFSEAQVVEIQKLHVTLSDVRRLSGPKAGEKSL